MNKYSKIEQKSERLRLTEAWKSKEAQIKADSPEAYDLEWGRLREEFYGEVGQIPLPPIDITRLASMKDKYKGQRIFIIGNGPSINRTPLHLLKDEYTFGVNRIYLLYDRIKWKPSFYTALDWRVVPDVAREINALTGSTFFFEERFRGLLREGDDVYYYTHGAAPADRPEDRIFSHDMSHGLRGAGSVIGTAVQIAFHLGFDPIYLIGCDLGYKVPETVQQEGDDRFGNGVKLHLTSTEDDDANHFDPRYFGKGRRWHDPNVKRMIEGHEQCRKGIESVGRRIYNATIGGELEVYERQNFVDLFPNEIVLNSRREDARSVDETEVVSHILRERTGRQHVMLDVGAHRGSSAQYFDKLNWSVHCFEPDANNRDLLTKRFGKSKNVNIDPRAVSDKPAKGVQFFTSPESSGISGLLPFRDTHVQSDLVEVTTIAEVAEARGLSKVDFLKIDVEGYDLNVLKGVPWDTLRPEVIECEFEDAKTLKLGHSWKDVAEYLRQLGYTVYLSEWHPIQRYGTAHDWRRLVPYPGVDMPENSWGNILAFQEDPGFEALSKAFEACLKQRTEKQMNEPTESAANKSTSAANPKADNPVQAGQALNSNASNARPSTSSSKLSVVSQPSSEIPSRSAVPQGRLQNMIAFSKLSLGHLWARRVWTLPIAALVGVLFLSTFGPIGTGYASLIRSGLIAAILAGAIAYIAFRTFSHVVKLNLEIASLRTQMAETNAKLQTMRDPFAAAGTIAVNRFIESKVDPRIRELTHSAVNDFRDQSAKVDSALGRLSAAVDQNSLETEAVKTSFTGHLEDLENSFAEQLQSQTSAYASKLKELQDSLDQLTAKTNTIDKWTTYDNRKWYQHFNRGLQKQHIDTIEQTWKKTLNVPVSRHTLGYMANRASLLEQMMDGRLATSIEDILLRTLIAQSVKSKNIDILEIGTLFGTGAGIMFDHLDKHFDRVHFTLLDPLDGYYRSGQADGPTGLPVTEEQLRRNLARVGMTDGEFDLIKELSTAPEAIEAASKQKYDVLIIDGDHSYAGVKADFENYVKTVKLGGYIIFDDYSAADWPAVQQYVDAEIESCDFVARVGASWRTCAYRVVKTPNSQDSE